MAEGWSTMFRVEMFCLIKWFNYKKNGHEGDYIDRQIQKHLQPNSIKTLISLCIYNHITELCREKPEKKKNGSVVFISKSRNSKNNSIEDACSLLFPLSTEKSVCFLWPSLLRTG